VSDVHVVQVLQCLQALLDYEARLLLAEAAARHEALKEFTALTQLHHEVYVVVVQIRLVELDDGGMVDRE